MAIAETTRPERVWLSGAEADFEAFRRQVERGTRGRPTGRARRGSSANVPIYDGAAGPGARPSDAGGAAGADGRVGARSSPTGRGCW